MKHLVLGSAGQIGHHLCSYLLMQGEEVTQIDIVNDERQDLRKQSFAIFRAVEESDFVYFLAYDIGGSKYLAKHQHSFEFINNNMLIMSNVFSMLKELKKPFIFASSQMADMNHSSYGLLKALGEKSTVDLYGTITRFWNVYGWESNIEKSHVITDFIRMGMENKVIKMRTTGRESRQFLYATDCAKCLYEIAKNHSIHREMSYDVTSFKWNTISEVADIVGELTGAEVIPGVREDTVQMNAMNSPRTKILKYWTPDTSLKDGIKLVKSLMYP